MSSSSQEKHAELHGELDRELRQFTGLCASIFRVAAARLDLTVTDRQVLDLLESAGPTTAGQLADLTGLDNRGNHRDAQPVGGGWTREP